MVGIKKKQKNNDNRDNRISCFNQFAIVDKFENHNSYIWLVLVIISTDEKRFLKKYIYTYIILFSEQWS